MAVTAYPVILVDSATGSDSAASGAGPSTALTGTGASTDTGTGSSQIVTLDAGTDLTNVATDGSHVIYLVDATAGHRNFAAINAKAGSGGATPTVTVEQAFTISLSGKSWAIGGKRASIGSATSLKLVDNNSSAGDAAPGWIVQMQSGHTESLSSVFNIRCAGDSTAGRIWVEGVSGALTRPVLTWTADVQNILVRGAQSGARHFDIQSSVTNTGTAIGLGDGFLPNGTSAVDMRIVGSHSYSEGVHCRGASTVIESCKITLCSIGIKMADVQAVRIIGNTISGTTSHGIFGSVSDGWDIKGFACLSNAIVNSGGRGILLQLPTDTSARCAFDFIGNTIDGSTSHGLEFTDVGNYLMGSAIANNIFSNNGGYGLNFSASSLTAQKLLGYLPLVLNNDYYNNTSGAFNPSGLDTAGVSVNGQTLDPSYTGSGNYTPTNASLAGTAYPLSLP